MKRFVEWMTVIRTHVSSLGIVVHYDQQWFTTRKQPLAHCDMWGVVVESGSKSQRTVP
jgi:hypothetical protein